MKSKLDCIVEKGRRGVIFALTLLKIKRIFHSIHEISFRNSEFYLNTFGVSTYLKYSHRFRTKYPRHI